MARGEDWNDLRGEDDDGDDWDHAIEDLDRNHEHEQYYEAQRRANELAEDYRAAHPDDDDLDGLHDRVDKGEAARAAACDVAEQRYTWHGRWDKKDHEGHETAADNWATNAHKLWKSRGERNVEEEHDLVDRRHAWGGAMLAGYGRDDQEDDDDVSEDGAGDGDNNSDESSDEDDGLNDLYPE